MAAEVPRRVRRYRRAKTRSSANGGDADLRIKMWEELRVLMTKDNLVEAEHAKARRMKKKTRKDDAWASQFSFSRKILRVLCGFFEHQRRVQFEGCVAEPLRTITAILLGSKWSCLLLCVVLRDALSEVLLFTLGCS